MNHVTCNKKKQIVSRVPWFMVHGSYSMVHRGFSLVETLFYIIIFAFALLAIAQTLIVMTASYRMLSNAQRIERDAAASLERLVREIRDAGGASDAGSTFNAHPGKLFLNSSNASGTPKTVEFVLEGNRLKLKENGASLGFLTGTTTSVSSLMFRKVTTPRSVGIKIELTLRSGTTTSLRSENFYATAVLRDSY